jgi:Ca-activated chloride channel family protein
MSTEDCKPSRIEASKRAAQQYIMRRAESSPQDRIALVSFSEYAEVVLPLTNITDTATITKALKGLHAGGGTDINEGLEAAERILFEDRSRDVQDDRLKRILLLTDGHGGHPIRTARRLKSCGVLIEVIGIGGDPSAVNEKLLRKVATTDSYGTHYWFFRDTDSLVAHYDNLATGIVFRGHDR